MSKTIIIKNGDVKGAFKEIAEKSVLNNLWCCKFCGYSWVARKEKPRQCPNCKRQIKYKK